MKFRRIASRIASRSYVLNEVEAAFESEGVYPPAMQEIAPDTYEGEIDTGWTLKVKEQKGGFAGPSLDVYLNGKLQKSMNDAAKEYKQNKSKPPSAITKTGDGVRIAPDSGPGYELRNYNLTVHYKGGVNIERIDITFEIDAGRTPKEEVSMDVESGQGFVIWHKLEIDGVDVTAEANDWSWQEIGYTGEELATRASEVFEDSVAKHKNEIPEWGEGKFFDWLFNNNHKVIDGVLHLNPEAGKDEEED
jgi:hypothetical protein